MNRIQFHLLANLSLSLIIFALLATFVNSTIQIKWLSGAILFVLLIGGLYFAHNVAPYLTGRIVEKLCDRFGIERQ